MTLLAHTCLARSWGCCYLEALIHVSWGTYVQDADAASVKAQQLKDGLKWYFKI